VKKSPKSTIPHINYGLALLDAGTVDEVLRELLKKFDKGVIINDSCRSLTANNNIGVAYISKKDIHNAERRFLKAYEYSPGYYRTSYRLGLIDYLKGKSGGSQEDYRISKKYIMNKLKVLPCTVSPIYCLLWWNSSSAIRKKL
jgi:tetratricopeptide (TPR) repeat protein